MVSNELPFLNTSGRQRLQPQRLSNHATYHSTHCQMYTWGNYEAIRPYEVFQLYIRPTFHAECLFVVIGNQKIYEIEAFDISFELMVGFQA